MCCNPDLEHQLKQSHFNKSHVACRTNGDRRVASHSEVYMFRACIHVSMQAWDWIRAEAPELMTKQEFKGCNKSSGRTDLTDHQRNTLHGLLERKQFTACNSDVLQST